MDGSRRREANHISQLLILGSYTAMALGLSAEVVLMSWELWALPLIIGAVAACWGIHIRQVFTDRQRIWVYTSLMMATFFFYGIHVTSTYDMALLMVTMMIVYTATGESALVTFGQITYYFTLVCDLAVMSSSGVEWDSLLISRTALHIALMFMAGWLARFIIRQWEHMFSDSDAQIVALDKASKRMNVFVANLSHELRTPVNAILGVSETLLDRPLDAEARADVETVRAAGRRMAAQISDILDYSEIETDRLALNEAPYTPASLFNDLIAELRGECPPELELVFDVDADVPEEMLSDAGKLRKILYHIIGNALKYTVEGGVCVRVRAVRQSYGVNLCVEVRDTGIGMTQDEIEQVAHRFYQADSRRAIRAGGLGIGLPIAYGLTRALGGFLMIDSVPGEGTTVRVSIPQKIVDDQNCMSVADRSRVRPAFFLNIEKFAHPYVREFYSAMLANFAQGLELPLHRAGSLEDLKKLTERERPTHLFVGIEEYCGAADDLEDLAQKMTVVLVSFDKPDLPDGSAVHWMPKPLCGFPFAALLNAPNRPGEAAKGRLSFPGAMVLVVDDEPMNLSVATALLRRYGMEVATAASGPEAIALCGTTRFDLIFMDHMMPEMDGVEAMKRLKRLHEARHDRVPVVALTANALSTAREMFIEEGFDGFVSKPIEVPELERVLKRVLPGMAAQSPVKPPREAPADMEGEIIRRLSEAGVNTHDGLRYCHGDAAFYLSMLSQFTREYPNRRKRLDACRAQGDLKNYVVAVHALKSSARMIGADALSELARALEAAGKDGRADAVDAGHDAMIGACAAFVSTLADCGVPCGGVNVEIGFAPADADEILEFAPAADDAPLEFPPEGAKDA